MRYIIQLEAMVYQRALVFGNYQRVHLCFYGLPTGLYVFTYCIEFESVYLQMYMFVSRVIHAYIYTLVTLYIIREYGSILYVGMAWKNNGRLYISFASDELKSLVIYTDKF